MVIKRVAPVSCAKVAGTVYAALGLILGAVVAMFALVNGMAANSSRIAGLGMVFGAGGLIIAAPIIYGCIGYIGTLLLAALYNVAANVVGGIEMDVE